MKPTLPLLFKIKSLLLTGLMTVLSASSWAQTYAQEFGVISKNEFDLTTYEADPEAEAVVLFDIGLSIFRKSTEGGFEILFTRTRRIKILSNAGIDHSEIEIPYYVDGYGKTEKIQKIEAHTYNMVSSGSWEKHDLEKQSIYDEQKNKYYRSKKFTFPNVQVGSVIEYRYEHVTPFKFNLPDWNFQSDIPTVFSQYTVKMIPFFEYVYILQGDSLSRQESFIEKGLGRSFNGIRYQNYVHVYEKEHVPAFKDESYISSVNDYISKIDFQLSRVHQTTGANSDIITTWPIMIKELWDHANFGRYIKKASKIAVKEILPKLNLEGKTNGEKCQILVEYMKQNFNWDNYYGKYASQDAKHFLLRKEGNAADINLFTVGVLRAAGIDATPVILSTRDHGKIFSAYPFHHYFNFVIVMCNLDGYLKLSDASDPLVAYDQLPPFCINEYGLVVDGNGSWVTLESNSHSSSQYIININLEPDSLDANIMLASSYFNLKAYQKKRRYSSEEDVIEDFEEGDQIAVNDLKIIDKNDHIYRIYLDGTTRVEQFQNQLLISPFLNLPPQKNPFKQAERNYPVDFIYRTTYTFKSIIKVPKAYTITYIPENLSISNDLLEVQYSTNSSETNLMVEGLVSFKKAVYGSEEYHQLKANYENIVKKFNEKVIVSKK